MLFYEKEKKNRILRDVLSTHIDNARKQPGQITPIQHCIQTELDRYFELLEDQEPSDLYRMVMSQVEHTLIEYVLQKCGNNQSKAAAYLGISRGTLRNKLNH